MFELGNLSGSTTSAPMTFVLIASLLVISTVIVGCIIGMMPKKMLLDIFVAKVTWIGEGKKQRKESMLDGWISGWVHTIGAPLLRVESMLPVTTLKSLILMPTLAYKSVIEICCIEEGCLQQIRIKQKPIFPGSVMYTLYYSTSKCRCQQSLSFQRGSQRVFPLCTTGIHSFHPSSMPCTLAA